MNQHIRGRCLILSAGAVTELKKLMTKKTIIKFKRGEGRKLPLKKMPRNQSKVFKFIDTIIFTNFKWESYIHKILKLAHDRFNFLQKLKKISVSTISLE